MNVGSAAGTVANIGGLVASLTGNPEIGRYISLAGATPNGAKALADMFTNGANTGNVMGAIQAVLAGLQASGVIKPGADTSAAMKSVSTALTAANAILTQTGFGAAVAGALNSAMKIYEGAETGQSPAEIITQSFVAGSPIGMLDLGGGMSQSIHEAFLPSHDWRTFSSNMMARQKQQGAGFANLAKALPYATTKEELGRLINTYKNYVSTTTDQPLEDRSGVNDPYKLSAIPGAGATTHNMPTPGGAIDWGPAEQSLQRVIDAYKEMLPGDPITALYEQGGGLSGEPLMRLWSQHLDREKNAPLYLPQDVPSYQAGPVGGEGGSWQPAPIEGMSKGFYGAADVRNPNAMGIALGYGAPGYDYAGAGYPMPNQMMGQVSPQWQALTSGTVDQTGGMRAMVGSSYSAPGTSSYQPGSYSGGGPIGQRPGAFAGPRSSLTGSTGAVVDPSITQGVKKPTTGFVSAPATNKGGV